MAAAEEPFVPAPADQIPNYSATVLPCEISGDPGRSKREQVVCKDNLLRHKTLRELSILRNTIFARYGWDGYRKEWLRNHIHAQPWFKPNPKFHYRLISEIDRKNVHLIATYEQTMSETELEDRRDEIYTRYGKIWDDQPTFTFNDEVLGKYDDGGADLSPRPPVKSCTVPDGADEDPEDDYERERIERSRYCRAQKMPGYKPDPTFTEDKLSAEDRIELGLISRSLGRFAVDDRKRGAVERSLDTILDVKDLRQLSLRDLRVLRNTIFARHGRPFVSAVLQQHFDGMDWYKKNPAYTDAMLTETDKRNVKLIQSVESEFGGALKDEDFLIDPSVDIA
jgi:hypothetical protein